MREILFRGRGDKKYNDGLWYYGVPIQDCDGDWQICANCYKRTIIPKSIGQYTGLTDKNGTMIFENDIVLLKGNEEPYTVKFDECCFRVYGDSVCYVMDNFYGPDIEVIGNEFDNPDVKKCKKRGEKMDEKIEFVRGILLMKIKTIVSRLDNYNDFDNSVNKALEAGWKLVKRDVLIPQVQSENFHSYHMLYAELERDD